jgi:hypothetical protein
MTALALKSGIVAFIISAVSAWKTGVLYGWYLISVPY